MITTRLITVVSLVFFTMTGGHSLPVIHYHIDTTQPQQTMENFGASDAWSMQHIGLWPKDKREQVADWLFSMETDEDGKPKGIGLSLWRFNIGAGSAEQGVESQIGSPWTRTECFLQADRSYNWDKQQGQREFLHLAKERGVDKFLAFLNSPPVFFTMNGLATNTGRGGTLNLKAENYGKFACFMADVIEGVEKHDGIKFDYICPFNEPDGHWNWVGPKQEGTPATNREIASIIRLLDNELTLRGLDTRILINESSDYRCMFDTHMTDYQRGYEIQSFFSPDSTDTYVGNLSHVPRMMVGHSYWTNTPLRALRDYRKQLRDTLDKYQVGFWQTETCIMGNDEEIGGGNGFDPTMRTALYVARIIHHDIVYAKAESWHWWRAIGGDYKDGLIREYANPDLKNGKIEDSKLMWVLGNYSRFVRPGAIRMHVTTKDDKGTIMEEGDTQPERLMCTAYRNKNGQWVTVIINYAETEQCITLSVDDTHVKAWRGYVTSDRNGENLAPVSSPYKTKDVITIPPRSVVTFVSCP